MVKIRNFVHESENTSDTLTWLKHFSERYGEELYSFVKKACLLTDIVGDDQPTFLGESCLKIGMEMAEEVAELKMDKETIIAALLYPFVQYDQLNLEDIAEEMGNSISKLIQGVKKTEFLHSLHHYSSQYGTHPLQLDNLRRMMLAIVEDVRVVILILVERLSIMRHLRKLSPLLQKRIAQESMDIYAPLANRLGIGQLKWEIEDLAFSYLEPEAYKEIANHLDSRRIDREHYISTVIGFLKDELSKNNMPQSEVHGRVKHIYSICKKMRRKNIEYEKVYDVSAIRILVPTIADCYAALGIVHSLWEHIPEEFDDYIANPKPNGYCSIHTAVQGPESRNLEVQIRTFEMHREAELGVAAHWIYKENIFSLETSYQAKISLLRQVLEWQQNITEKNKEEEDIASVSLDDRVYIFTPTGQVIDLPKGATPLDFAYYLHTDLGNHCRGAKVNGRMTPLTYPLNTGEQVEILTGRHVTPSRDWLNASLGFLKTSKARAKVHQWFKKLDLNAYIEEGIAILEKETRKIRPASEINHAELAKSLKFQTPNELYIAIATQEIKLNQLVQALTRTTESNETALPLRIVSSPIKAFYPIIVSGLDNILTHPAQCCKPIPGNPIIGFIAKEHTISIHYEYCENVKILKKRSPSCIISVEWNNNYLQNYPVDLYLYTLDRPHLMSDICSIVATEKLNIISITSKLDKPKNLYCIILTLEVPDTAALEKITLKIKQSLNIDKIYRRQ